MKEKISLIKASLASFVGISFARIANADWNDGIEEIRNYNLPEMSIYGIIVALLQWLLMIFTAIAVISFIVYGIMFLAAGASKDAAEKAKNGVQYSIMGIVIGLAGYIIINFLDAILRGNIQGLN
ncbi:MAG: hypothetical protein U5L10_05435 [Candidatus Moranbacteria bacterium]|nr:hypothetical protein [Candidatus Moranbacteria bacterium]